MVLTNEQLKILIEVINGFIDLSERAMKEDPKHPRMNAEVGLPGLYTAKNILTGSNFPIDE